MQKCSLSHQLTA